MRMLALLFALVLGARTARPDGGKPLQKLGTVLLSDRPYEGPIRNIRDFHIDAAGRLGFLRREPHNRWSLVLLDRDGAVLSETRLPFLDERLQRKFAPLQGSRWLLIDSVTGFGGESKAWWIDADR